MATITKVTQQLKPGRYNIYVDDEYAFAVDETILIKYNLFKGTQLTPEEINQIEAAEFEQKAYQKALVYATGRLRAKGQIIQKLREQAVPKPVIARVIDRLEAVNVINDQHYAQAYVHSMVTSGKLGPRGIRYKLQQLRIAPDDITDALVDYDDDDQLSHLAHHVEKLMHKYERQAHYMAVQKTRQKLQQLGFDTSLINQAMQDYDLANDPDDDQEWDNLNHDALIAANRYRQYEGWEFKKRIKAAMFRKGYDFSLVDKWISQYDRKM